MGADGHETNGPVVFKGAIKPLLKISIDETNKTSDALKESGP